MPIRKEDIVDVDFVDAPELAATGTVNFVSSVSVVSTTSSSKTVVVSGFYLLVDENRVEPGDKIILSGNAAAGTYTVATITDNSTLTVSETIADSTGGTAAFRRCPGAKKVGFNSTGLTITSANNVQDAIFELAQEVESGGGGGGSGFTDTQHRNVRHLIHFINEGPAGGFASGAYKELLPLGNPFPTSIIWWTSSAKTDKIIEKTITYNGNKTFDTIKWEVYGTDGYTVYGSIVDTYSYSGVIETTRSRSITENVAPSGSGLTTNTHRTVRQLIHFIDEGPAEGFTSGAYRETLPLANPFPTSITWWTDSSKTDKIVEKNITWNSNSTVNTVEWKMYDVDGATVLTTVIDTYSYSGIFETDRTRSIS